MPMGIKKETILINWGDGKKVKIKKPNLEVIPGVSVICPMPCHPVGDTGDQWLEKEKKSHKKNNNAKIVFLNQEPRGRASGV